MMPNKKILIISYTFPPSPGIGGRRWAKFAKYLTTHYHHSAYILTNQPTNNNYLSDWLKDTLAYHKNIFHFKNSYPSIINKKSYSFLDKIKYRLALIKLKLRFRGNYYDKTCLLDNDFLIQVEKIVNKYGIRNIIVTVGPFNWLSLIIKLKSNYPGIQFIADFRDPWTNNKTSFGYSSLSKPRFEFEKSLEKEVIENYDKIISVSPEMNSYFASLSELTNKEKFVWVPNGFDTEDSPEKTTYSALNDKLRFVFTGTLYNKTEHLTNALIKALNKLKIDCPDVFNNIDFSFYGEMPKSIFEHLKSIENVHYNGHVPLREVYNQIRNADICMLFLTEDLGYSMSTKFFEYLSQRKSIAVFSSDSKTGSYVVANKLGYNIAPQNIYDKIIAIHEDWKNGKLVQNADFDISEFDIKKISGKIDQILI